MHLPRAIRFRKQRRQIRRFKDLETQALRSPARRVARKAHQAYLDEWRHLFGDDE